MRALSKANASVEAELKARFNNAVACHCWRVACARIRDLAKLYKKHGKSYKESLKDLNYDYYRTAVKRRYNEL